MKHIQPSPALKGALRILSVAIAGATVLAVPNAASAWTNRLQDPGFDRYHFDEIAGYYVPDFNAAWTELGFGRASVRFDASSWIAPSEMTAERPLAFTPGTTGYEGPGPTENSGRITLQQDVLDPSLGGKLYEAWLWLGGAGLDDNTGTDNKDEGGGWEIYFYWDPNPVNWTDSNAIEYHHSSLDYPGQPYSFVRVSGFGKVPNGAAGFRFRAWASSWYGPAGPGNFSTRVAIDNAHFAIIEAPNLLVNGNFEQDLNPADFVGWNRPAAWPFPKNGQNPVLNLRNTYGANVDHGTFRPYWGGARAYGYETYVYGAWIDDAFTFSQVVDCTEPAGTPMTFMFYWLQDTANPDKRSQLRNHGGEIGAVIEYLDAGLQPIGHDDRTVNWPVAGNPADTCRYDQNAGSPYNPRFELIPPPGTEKIRVNVNVMTHLLYSPELSLTSHLVDDFYLGYSRQADSVFDVAPGFIGHTTASIGWRSNNPLSSAVDFGPTTAYGQTVTSSATTVLHAVQLSGLAPARKYYYRVRSGTAVWPDPADADQASLVTMGVGDFDLDEDIDQEDFGRLQGCFTGPQVPQNDEYCQITRLDADDDVDEVDLAIFLGCMSGPDVSYDIDCVEVP